MKKIIIFLTILFLVIISFIKLLDNYYSDKTKDYIYIHTTKIIQNNLTKSLNNGIINNLDSNELVNINYNQSTNVSDVIINTNLINQLLLNTNTTLENNFKNNNEYILEVPLGTLISENLFAGKGRIIKIPIIQTGTFITDITTDTKEFGINSSKVDIYLNINFDCLAVIPFNQSILNIDYQFLLGSFVIMGDVPNYYYASSNKESFPYIPN